MKSAIAVAVTLLCGIAGVDLAHSQDVALSQADLVDGSMPDVRVVFHQGVVLGIGKDSLLTYTPEKGLVVVQYADGQVVEGHVSPLPKSTVVSGTAWEHHGSLVGLRPDLAKAGGCSNEQSALGSAIAGVAAACQPGSGETLVCTAARDFLREAYASYNECVGRLIQQK
jgi:hypothetical protein